MGLLGNLVGSSYADAKTRLTTSFLLRGLGSHGGSELLQWSRRWLAGINNLFDEDLDVEIRDEGIVPAYKRDDDGGSHIRF